MNQREIAELLQTVMESSIYVAPRDPGLTREEIFEVGKRFNLLEGEIGDALPEYRTLKLSTSCAPN